MTQIPTLPTDSPSSQPAAKADRSETPAQPPSAASLGTPESAPPQTPESGSGIRYILATPLRWMRRAYDWTLAQADKPQAEQILFGLSFAEASFFPIPPDPLLLAMGAGQPKKAIRFAIITTVASVIGAMLGYVIGSFLFESVGEWLLGMYDPDREVWGKIQGWYDEYGVLALFLAAITPIPFKVFTIASGAMALPFLPFVGFSLLGRSVRFMAEGVLLRFFGRPIVEWVDKWFNLAAAVFAVLLIGGFLAIKFIG